MKPGDDGRTRAWSAYWSQGVLHSCAGSYAANYGGAIGAFWDRFIDGIAPGSRMLDLATGNGALPLRAWERLGPSTGTRIDAVDLAALAPPWHRPDTHAGIRFHSGVAMEALPFADATFDRVCSQFGLEYARRPDAVRECLRVATPDAQLAFVLHHAGSVLVEVGRTELAHQERLLARDGLLACARRVLPWIAQARAGGPPPAGSAATRDRAAYNAAVAKVAREVAVGKVPDALVEARDWIHRLLAGATPATLEARTAALDGYQAAVEAAALRTREMLEHALDRAQVEELAALLHAGRPDWAVRYEPLEQDEGVLAWALVASAPSTSNSGPSPAA